MMNAFRRSVVLIISTFVFATSIFAQVPGAIDTTFAVSGRVRVNFSNKVLTDASAGDVAVQVKTNVLDANYGKLVVVGFSEDNNRPMFGMIRLNPNGTRDQGFGVNPDLAGTDPNNTDGVIKEYFGSWDTMTNVAIQADQKILALGYIVCTAAMKNSGECLSSEDWRLVRYNKNGDRDATFANNGVRDFKIALGGACRTRDVQVDSQGRIYAAGYANDGNSAQIFVFRLLPNGAFDTTWDDDGMLQLNPTAGNVDQAWGLRIQKIPTGNGTRDRVIIGARADNPLVLGRYADDPDGGGPLKGGSPDSTFGSGGQVSVGSMGSNSYIRGIDLDDQQRILAAGKTDTNRGFLMRFTRDGVLDATFDGDSGTGNGIVTQPVGVQNWYDDVEVEQVANGRIVAGGWVDVSQNDRRMAAFRHLHTGQMDSSFKSNEGGATSNGVAIVDGAPGFTSERGNGVAIDQDGNVLLPGDGDIRVVVNQQTLAFEHMFVARFRGTDGVLDPNFNKNGQVLSSLVNKPGLFATRLTGGSADIAYGVVTQSDGKVVMVGKTHNGWDEDFMITRVQTDGNLDLTFGADDPDYDDAARRLGKISYETGNISNPDNTDIAYSVAMQSTGKIVVAGTTNDGLAKTRVFRLNTNGTLDTTFNNNATWTINDFIANNDDSPRKIIVDASDRIYLVGGPSENVLLARYSSAGVLQFSTVYNDPDVTSEEARDIALVPDADDAVNDKIVVAGKGRQGIAQDQMWVGRFNVSASAFTIDNTFSLGRTFDTATNTIIAPAAYQGAFTIPHETRATPTAGTPNPVGTSIADFDEAWGVVVEADGKVTLGGRTAPKDFMSGGQNVDPRPRYAMVRLLSSGWIDTSFGTNGWVSTYMDTNPEPIPPNNLIHDSEIKALLAQHDGRLVGLGTAGRTNDKDFSAARYLWTTGALDTSYATGQSNMSKVPVGNDNDIANAGTLSGDGRAIVAGYDFVREDFIAARWQGDNAPTGNHASVMPDLTTDTSRANFAGTTDNRTNDNTPTFSFSGGCVSGETAILKIVNTTTNFEHPYRARTLCSSNGAFTATVPSYLASGGTLFFGQNQTAFLPDGTYQVQSYSATGFGKTAALSQTLTNIVIDTAAAIPTLTNPTNLQEMNAEQPITFQGAGVEANSDVYVLDTTVGITWNAQTGKIATGVPVTNCTAFSAPGSWNCQTPAHPAAGALALGLHKVKVQQEDIAANKSIVCITAPSAAAGCAAEHQFYVKADTATTAASSSANATSVYGEAVTFTATVSTNVDKPDGTVIQTYDGVVVPPPAGTPVVQCVTVGCHTSSVTHTPALPLSVGNHTYSASYPETDKFFASATAVPAVTQIVNKANTSIAVTPTSQAPFVPSTTNSVYGQSVTFTAVLSVDLPGHRQDATCPQCANPTGTVTLKIDNGAPLTLTFANQQAAHSTAALSVGQHTLEFTYSGDGNFATKTVTFNHTVEKGATSTALGSSANPSVEGANITLTGTVTPTAPAAGTRTGSLHFKNGGASVTGCEAVNIDVNGAGPCLVSALTKGTHAFTVEYSGDGNFHASNGNLSQQVFGPPTIAKAFGSAFTFVNGTATLTFTLQNPAGNPGGLNGVAFTDTLPAGMVVATPNGLSGTCGTGTITAVAGSGVVSLSGGTLAASGSCTFSVNVTATTTGTKVNTTGNVTSTEGGAGLTATASIEVVEPLTFTKAFGVAAIPVGGSTSLTFSITNPNAGSASSIAFSDTLPAGLEVATPNNLTGTCGGGTITADAGTSIISLSGATLAGTGNCSFSVDVKGTTAGVKNNVTGAISSTETGTNGTASANLTVVGPVSIGKAFNPTQVMVGGSSTLTFTLTNGNAATNLTGVGFTDTLPAGLLIATPSNLTGTCGGGTITANAGESSISLSGATLNANANCSFSVSILGSAAGAHQNTTSTVSSAEGGAGAAASATLTVVGPPVLAKNFGSSTVALDDSTTLTFTVTNPPSNTVALSNVAFVDNLPAGVAVATPNGLTGVCGGGAITAVAGSSSISLSGATLGVGGSCAFTVNVTMTSMGLKTNTTDPVTSTEGGTGNAAVATVTVNNAVTLSKSFTPQSIPVGGTSTLSFIVSNPNAGGATGVAFSDTLPNGLEVATPNGLTGTCGAGTISAVAGGGVISLSNGSVAGNGNCTFSVNVKATTAGVKTNTTGVISSTEFGAGGTASATLTVVAPPTIAKSFGALAIAKGTSTTLTFNLNNPNAGVALTGVGFTDTLPSGVVVATPNGLTGACSGGTITADAGTGSIVLSGATLAASGSCSFTVNVLGTTGGAKNNTTSGVTSVEGGEGAPATATLNVVSPPALTKAFGLSTIALDGTTSLTFNVKNPAENTVALTGVSFTDTLPAGLVIATPSGLSGSCSGGTISATAGSDTISLTGGVLPVQAICVFSVTIKATTEGVKTNTTSTVSSTEGGTGAEATASVTVTTGTPVPGLKSDANADDRVDIFWRHATNGANAVWLMNGASVQSGVSLPVVVDSNMTMVGAVDLDGDRMSDVIWRNAASGENATWLLTNGALRLGVYLPSVADSNMKIVGVGDFDNNGLGDFFWRNESTGENAVWLMNGTGIANSGMLATVADPDMKVRGVGDVNGDGRDDVIWRNQATGENAVWLMNGITKLGRYLPVLANADLVMAGVGDFNGDNKSDVLWQNTATGDVGIWTLDGNNVTSTLPLPTVLDLEMRIAAVGDVDGDGKSDIIFRHASTGENAVWIIDGGAVVGGGYLPTVSDTALVIKAPK